jgi:hypothetical protein
MVCVLTPRTIAPAIPFKVQIWCKSGAIDFSNSRIINHLCWPASILNRPNFGPIPVQFALASAASRFHAFSLVLDSRQRIKNSQKESKDQSKAFVNP